MFKRVITAFALLASPVVADPAVVQSVSVVKSDGAYTFNVTILHNDVGWNDYADSWRIKDMDGNVLGERQLAHPHVGEQPFTRSLSGVKTPAGLTTVQVEVHDTVNGWAPTTKTVNLP